MIQTKTQFNLKNAQQYFREHLRADDYYSEGRKVAGEWFGHGAEKLGLKDAVNEAAFLALCEGKHPETGLRLGQRLNSVRHDGDGVKANRRIFFDFTIAPPKSVSVVALYQDRRIVELHERAVRLALGELEKLAETRVRTSGQKSERVTGNLVAACFRHETSRELDPHLHTHCVVLNATFDPVENRWKALETGGMYRAHSFATNLYRHELCKGLRSLGYEIAMHSRGFEINDVPVSLIERFSKRHQQIDEETRVRLEAGGEVANIKDLREQVAHSNRRRKMKDATADRLRLGWGQQMQPEEVTALRILQARADKFQPAQATAQKADMAAILAWSDEHLFERRAVVHEHELLAVAFERGRGQDFDLGTLRQVVAERGYVREKTTDKLTSRQTLGWELEVVLAARNGQCRHDPLSPAYRASSALSAEQTVAVEAILRSRDFITLFRGGAGTGKSFTLKEVERGLVAAGRPVVVLAPQRQQVEGLQADGLPAETLAQCLQTGKLARGAVVIVDEAGQIGARQLAQLSSLVQASHGRMILSGDTRQHGAVAASDALRAIEKHSGLKPAVLRTIRRQDPKLGASSQQRAFISDYRSAVKSAAAGEVATSFDTLDRLGCIREVAPENRHAELAADYLAALARKERVLVVGQTRAEVRAVNECIREQLRAAGQLGESTSLTAFQAVDLSEAQKRDPGAYAPGQQVCFIRGYGRFAKNEVVRIAGANDHGVILEKDGHRSTISYRYADRLMVVTATEMDLAAGDRLQLKFNGKSVEGTRLNNGALVTVREVARDGSLIIESSEGERQTLGPSQRLFVRGYAVTSYGSQGKTVDTVLFSDAASRAATDARQWYVTISRARKQVRIFTEDKAALRARVQKSGERALALDLQPAQAVGAEVSREEQVRRALVEEACRHQQRHQAVMAHCAAAPARHQHSMRV